jgi:uncharacterized protein YndB with AHSA1/START domain
MSSESTQGTTMKTKFRHAPAELQIVSTRTFDAPRELVWRAFTDERLLARWWGQNSTTTIVDKLDVRPGGLWRFIQRSPDGAEYAFNGEFREVVPPSRLVQTFEFEGMPGHITVDAMTLEEHGGKTTITTTSRFATLEDLEGMVATGMEAGANESYDRLEALLSELQNKER